MFIKKDLRKIPRILADAAIDDTNNADELIQHSSKRLKRDFLKELKLARRKAEFNGSVKILCQPANALSLRHVISISIYDCEIKSLEGIGFLGSSVDGKVCCPSLEILNVGRNPISELPDELSMIGKSLKELWCDDCKINGALPDCIMKLDQLETLQMANNQISEIPSSVANLTKLRRLSLDRNLLKHLPPEMSRLTNLESLLLRNNQIQQLPENVPGPSMTHLRLLHISSNQLTSLPASLVYCPNIESLYANSNKIKSLPDHFGGYLPRLKRLNLCQNAIQFHGQDFTERFGKPDSTSGLCEKDDLCVVYMDPTLIESDSSASSDAVMAAE